MKKLLFIATFVFSSICACANNIQITNVRVLRDSVTIKFDISWENSWRSNTLKNWDAAWVFFKYKAVDGIWYHLTSNIFGNFVAPSGFTIEYANDGPLGVPGVFLYRSSVGSGTSTLLNVEVAISNDIATGIYDIKAYAVEMVYVPAASFYIGDGISTNSYNDGSGFPNQVYTFATSVTDPIATPSTNIYVNVSPVGTSAFYCMKYELSQGGYRDFLNTLTFAQQQLHTAVIPSSIAGTYALSNSFRNHLRIKTTGVSPNLPAVYGCDANNNGIFDEADDGETVACNFLNWADHARYLMWAGLRPLTELEYEKAARGIQLPVAGEYAWGNTNIAALIYTLSNPNGSNELVSNATLSPLGNANYNVTYPNAPFSGPLRNGIFATATSNRISSGASFYGIMELSGNLMERVITTANTQGRLFDGGHGNGYLTNNSTLSTWPAYNSTLQYVSPTNNATGLIYRGGGFNNIASFLRISDRAVTNLITDNNNVRVSTVGVRGCRSEPL